MPNGEEFFRGQFLARLNAIDERLERMDKKLDGLSRDVFSMKLLRASILGGAAAISALVSFLLTMARAR